MIYFTKSFIVPLPIDYVSKKILTYIFTVPLARIIKVPRETQQHMVLPL